MTLRCWSVAIALLVCATSAPYAQVPSIPEGPDRADFQVQVWGDVATDFRARLGSYVELRSRLESGLPVLTGADDPAVIRRVERVLARRIRVARRHAQRGDIFTPNIRSAFMGALLLEVDPESWASLMDDNPGDFSVRINGTYPEGKPLSTVPANILAALPQLPDAVQYRFVGRRLVLFDTKARVILDEIPYAIRPPRKR